MSAPAADVAREAHRQSDGKFGEQARHDPGQIDLGATGPGYVMVDAPITIQWWTMELPSPRHRNYVRTSHDVEVYAQIRTVTTDQAPMAFEVEGKAPFREFDGDLYSPHGWWKRTGPEDDDGPEFTAETVSQLAFEVRDSAASQEEALALAQERIDRMLVVDGRLWAKVPEPMYVVQTFGLGGDHGGTSMFVERHYNSSLGPQNYFRADEFKAARAHAVTVAVNRGDVQSAEALRRLEPAITVHRPEAVTAVMPRRESDQVRSARREYAFALKDLSDSMIRGESDAAQALERMTTAQSALAALTDDIAGVEGTREPHEDRPGSWRNR